LAGKQTTPKMHYAQTGQHSMICYAYLFTQPTNNPKYLHKTVS